MKIPRALFVTVLAVLPAVGLGCRDRDAMEEAKIALRDDPEKAVEILEKRARLDPNDFDAIVGLAQGYKGLKNWERMAASYRRALAHPKGQEKTQRALFREDLLLAVRQLIDIERKGNPSRLLSYLKEANALEQELGRQNIEAGRELFEMARSRFDALVAADKYEEALGELEVVATIYCEPTAKQALLDRAPDLRQKGFRRDALLNFDADLKDGYIRQGVYSADQKAFTFVTRTEVEIGAEGAPDPTQPTFAKDVEARGCGLLATRDALATTLSPFAKATVLGRELTKSEVATFHRLAQRNRKTRWDGEPWDATRGYDDGTKLTLVCQDSLPLSLAIEAFDVLLSRDQTQPQ